MGKKLVLAEKPSVGKEIARVLGCQKQGNGYLEGKAHIVTWAFGHLIELADPEAYDERYHHWVLEDLPIIPERMKTQVIRKSARQFNTLKQLVHRQEIESVVIATDAGREGELVARWALEKAKSAKPVKRLWISSVTDKAIRMGFEKLRDGKAYEALGEAAKARAESDWIVGINGTRALTTKYNAQLSLGRVQTPTLALVAKREEQIQKFSPRTFYGLSLHTDLMDFEMKWPSGEKRTFDEKTIDGIMREIKGKSATVDQISRKTTQQYAEGLYDLTALQSAAYKVYGYSPKKTLDLMQRLYERHKALTYPRTDSRYLTQDIVDTIQERLEAITIKPHRQLAFRLRDRIVISKRFVDDSKVGDHHAIIPTEESVVVSDLDFDERRIYEMVVTRFLEVLMPPAEIETVRCDLQVEGHHFEGKMQRMVKVGFREVRGDAPTNSELPDGKSGQRIEVKGIRKTSGKTSPPPFFNEATLLEAMENPSALIQSEAANLKKILKDTGGLGTVATRAEIIEKLLSTRLMEVRGKGLHVTKKGKQLLDLVPEELKSPLMTARWEQQLKAIEKGELDRGAFISQMREYTREMVEQIKRQKKTFTHDNLTREKCPDCGKPLMQVDNKHGKSLVCVDRDCGYRRRLSRVTNARCPECHKKMELRGTGDKQVFVCRCGYKESLSAFEKRKKERNRQGGKKDYQNYLKQQKQESEVKDNPFAKAFEGLDFD